MKKLILSAVVTILFATTALAQAPIIAEFRNIISNIPTNFVAMKKDLINENKDTGIQIFTTNLKLSPICQGIITAKKDGNNVLVLNYELANMDSLMSRMFYMMVPQYIKEINEMVQSGKYTGSDGEVDGMSTTTVKDLNGNIVVQYQSNSTEHRIRFFGNAKK